MKKHKKTLTFVLIILAFAFIPVCHFFVEKFHENIKQHPQRYCYQEYYGPPNPVLIVKSKSDCDELIKYYRKIEKNEEASFNFDLKTLPMYDPVYVIDYVGLDSAVAEVVSYFDYGRNFGGSYTRGYVYSKTLHLNPPNKKND